MLSALYPSRAVNGLGGGGGRYSGKCGSISPEQVLANLRVSMPVRPAKKLDPAYLRSSPPSLLTLKYRNWYICPFSYVGGAGGCEVIGFMSRPRCNSRRRRQRREFRRRNHRLDAPQLVDLKATAAETRQEGSARQHRSVVFGPSLRAIHYSTLCPLPLSRPPGPSKPARAKVW